MSKTQAGSKPVKGRSTTAKQSGKKPTVVKRPRKTAAPTQAKKPASARKPSPKAPARRQAEALLAAAPARPGADQTVFGIQTCAGINGVSAPAQASALYGGLSKSDARRIRRQFYAAGRLDLAAAPRALPS